MPVTPTYPGVYIEEVSSGVHPITGVATSITAFVGFAAAGPVNDADDGAELHRVHPRLRRALGAKSTMSYAVQQFFHNGGSQALIVRAATRRRRNLAKSRALSRRPAATTLNARGRERGAVVGASCASGSTTTRATRRRRPLQRVGQGHAQPASSRCCATCRRARRSARRHRRAVDSSSARSTPLPTRPTGRTRRSPGRRPVRPGGAPTQLLRLPSGATTARQAITDLVPATDDGTGMYALARADLFNLLVHPAVTRSAGPARRGC